MPGDLGLPPAPTKAAPLVKDRKRRQHEGPPTLTPRPKADGILVGTALPGEVVEAIKTKAAALGISKNQWVKDALLAAVRGPVTTPTHEQPGASVVTAALAQCLADRGQSVTVTQVAVDCLVFNPVAIQRRQDCDTYDVGLTPEAAARIVPQPPNRPEPPEKHRGHCDLCRSEMHSVRRVCLGGQWYYWCLACRKAQGVKANHPDGDPEVRGVPQNPTGQRNTAPRCKRCGYQG